MQYFKFVIKLTLAVTTLSGLLGCNSGGIGTSPFAISEAGVMLSPLKDNRVRLIILPQAASPGLEKIFVRVERSSSVVTRQALDWNYTQGVETDLGSAEQPLQSGDQVKVGTSEINSHVTLTVAP